MAQYFVKFTKTDGLRSSMFCIKSEACIDAEVGSTAKETMKNVRNAVRAVVSAADKYDVLGEILSIFKID